jgi:hypothetical protein
MPLRIPDIGPKYPTIFVGLAALGTAAGLITAPPTEQIVGKIKVSELQVGDLLAVADGGHGQCHGKEHWAVYLGTGEDIVRLNKDTGDLTLDPAERYVGHRFTDAPATEPLVRVDPLAGVRGRLFKAELDRFPGATEPSDRVVPRVLSRLHEKAGDAVTKNCQHFSSWARYGHAFSNDVLEGSTSQTLTRGGMVGGAVFLAALAVSQAPFFSTLFGACGWAYGVFRPIAKRQRVATLRKWEVVDRAAAAAA